MATEDRREYQRRYYQTNKERLLELQRERNRRDYQRNKAAYKARNDRWREENPERYKALTKAYNLRNREKVKQGSRLWYQNNKARAAATARRLKLKQYGLTLEQFEAMLISQNGKCAACERAMTSPCSKAHTATMVDHCHTTGRVRGLLCRRCNMAIGQFGDDPGLLLQAASYLIRS